MPTGITKVGNVTYISRSKRKMPRQKLTHGWKSETFLKLMTVGYKGFTSIFTYMIDLGIITELRPRSTFPYTYQSWRGWNINDISTRINMMGDIDQEFKEIAARLIHHTKTKTLNSMFQLVWNMDYSRSVEGLKWWDRRPKGVLMRGYGTAADRVVLLSGLLRTAGIPTRIVEGTWRGRAHGWMEVWYRNGWRVMDPSNPDFMTFKWVKQENGTYQQVPFFDMRKLNAQINRRMGYHYIAELSLNTSDNLDIPYVDQYIR